MLTHGHLNITRVRVEVGPNPSRSKRVVVVTEHPKRLHPHGLARLVRTKRVDSTPQDESHTNERIPEVI